MIPLFIGKTPAPHWSDLVMGGLFIAVGLVIVALGVSLFWLYFNLKGWL